MTKEQLKEILESQQREIEENNGTPYCKNCGLSGRDLLEKIDSILTQQSLDGGNK